MAAKKGKGKAKPAKKASAKKASAAKKATAKKSKAPELSKREKLVRATVRTSRRGSCIG